MSSDYGPLPTSNLSALPNNNKEITNYIRIYDQFLDHSLCDELITHLNSNQKYYQDHDYLRRAEFPVNPYSHPELYQKVKSTVQTVYAKYKDDVGPSSINLYQCNTLEFPNVVAYNPSSNKLELFHDHADCWHFDSCSRQVSIILYLSDVKEGGSTYFSHYDIDVQPRKGRILMFPSHFMFTHRANPPISDVKYACICWLHFDGPVKYTSLKM